MSPRRATLGFVAALYAALAVILLDAEGASRWRMDERGRGWRMSPSSDAGDSFTLADEFLFPVAAGYQLPTCTGDADCVALCKVVNSCTWQCYDNTGATTGVMTQKSQTCDDSFAGVRVLSNIQAGVNGTPQFELSGLDSMWQGDFTMVMSAYSANSAAFHGYLGSQGLVADGGSEITGLLLREESGVIKCTFNEGSIAPVASTTATASSWGVVAARRTGNSRVCRANGAWGSATTTALPTIPTAHASYGVVGQDYGSHPLLGPVAWVAFYRVAKSDAWIHAVEAAWSGAPSELSWASGGVTEALDAGGYFNVFSSSAMAAIDPTRGLVTQRSWLQKWATLPYAPSTWTAVGTPVIAENVGTGPLSRWRLDSGYSEVRDDDPAVSEGVRGHLSYALAGYADGGYYNASCVLATGDAGTARIGVVTDGAGTTYCNATLSSGFARYECAAAISGAPTYVKGELLVGTGDSDQGTIKVAQCQLSDRRWAEPITLGTTGGPTTQYLDLSGIPTITARGKVEQVFTAIYDPGPGTWQETGDTLYSLDFAMIAGGHRIIDIFGYNTPDGRMLARLSGGAGDGGDNDVNPVARVEFTPGTRYVTSVEWVPHAGYDCTMTVRLDPCPGSPTTCHASTVLGTSVGSCPGQPERVYLNARFTGVFSSGYINAVRIYQ